MRCNHKMTNAAIYIPSKGRASKCITAAVLVAGGIDSFFVVVEPGQQNAYAAGLRHARGAKVLVLPRKNKGIAYARRWIQGHAAKADPGGLHWQLDDDVTFAARGRQAGKYRTREVRAGKVLDRVEKYMRANANVAVASPRNRTYAFGYDGKPPVTVNRQCVTCMLLRDVDLRFRSGVIEDTDYSMQVLHRGLCTAIFNRLLFTNPPQASVDGGNSDHLHHDRITELQRRLARNWNGIYPGAFQITERGQKGVASRVRPSRVWGLFAQRPRSSAPGSARSR